MAGKTAVRAAVTPSPEPLSNIGLSLGEDALAIFLTWFATRHPYIAAALALCFRGGDCSARALGNTGAARAVPRRGEANWSITSGQLT